MADQVTDGRDTNDQHLDHDHHPRPRRRPRSPATSITVDTASPGGVISPGVFGSDYLAPFNGMGSFDTATGAFWPSFTTQLTSEVGAGSLRFPGGITGQSYQWTRAVGAQGQRQDNPVGPNGRPSPSTVGPDEFGQLLDLTGAQGVFDVDFANGTAQEAANLVQYMTGTNPSNQFVAQRAQNGHSAPYDVPYWEVGNEEETPQFWRAGSIVSVTSVPGVSCPDDPTGLYICGGTTSFSGQAVVGNGNGDRSPSSSTSHGQAGQTFQVAYPSGGTGLVVLRPGRRCELQRLHPQPHDGSDHVRRLDSTLRDSHRQLYLGPARRF